MKYLHLECKPCGVTTADTQVIQCRECGRWMTVQAEKEIRLTPGEKELLNRLRAR